MPAVKLPNVVSAKFDELTRHIRRLRLYRGASRVALAALALAAIVMLMDAQVGFSTSGRWLALFGWALSLILLAWLWIVRPLKATLTASTLAAAIEHEFESLKERLFTLVELSETDDAHGSKPLIDVLVRETSNRAKKLKVDKAAPRAPVFRLMAAAVAGAALALGVVLANPAGAERVRRFLLPWHTPKVEAPFAVKVSSGSPVVKRGDAVTLTGYLERTTPGESPLPTTATLQVRDAAGATRKFPMTSGANATFTVTRPGVQQGFEYAIASGGVQSDWQQVIAADPVELAEGTTIELVPPDYAVPPLAKQTLKGFAEFEALQHTNAFCAFKFNRPAMAATLEWVATAPGAMLEKERVQLVIATDRKTAKASLPLMTAGTYRLTLTGEHGLTTNVNASARVTIDSPPKFEKVTGLAATARACKPDEVVRIHAAASDDFRVAAVELEYTVNNSPPVVIPLVMKESSPANVEGKLLVKLKDLVKDGDTFKYRLKATDNREVPAAGLKPQVTFMPEASWSTLKITTTAESLDTQEVKGARDAIELKLDAAAKALNEARRHADDVQRESQGKPLTPGQKAELEQAKDAVNKAAEAVEQAAREAGLSPELQSLAQGLNDAAQESVKPAGDAVDKAGRNPDNVGRAKDLAKANEAINDAAERIDKLRKMNDDLARNRLDKRRLEKLADEIERLGHEAGTAKTPAERDRVLKDLQRQRDELQNLVRENDTLRNASEKKSDMDAETLRRETETLAGEQKKLNDDVKKAEAQARAKDQAANAKAQEELNKEVDELKKKHKPENPPANEPFEQAAKELKDGNAIEAMTAQEKAAKELDRMAADAKAGPKADPDAAKTAEDLAKRQRELRDDTANTNAKPSPAPKADEQQKKQEDLNKKAEELSKKMDQAANAPGRGANGGDPEKMNEAAQDTKAASEAMAKAGREQKAGREASAAEARDDAAKKLDKAAGKAGEAAGAMKPGDAKNPDANAAAAAGAAQAAGQKLREAGPQVGKQDPNAKQTLKEAADKVNEAAEKLGQAGPPQPGKSTHGKPNGNDGGGSKPLTSEELPPDMKQYAGTRWGDLPGEVKTKIVQDLKAKYGEDYARAIKLYFEQQAEKK